MINPWVIISFIVALAVSNAGSFLFGKHVEEGEAAQVQLESERLAAALLNRKQKRVDTLGQQLAQAKADRAGRDRIIVQEVYRYEHVTPAADRCTLPGAWRLRHDLAATGESADPARLAAGDAQPVTDAAALGTVAGNYIQCRDAIEQVKGWQAWWSTVQ